MMRLRTLLLPLSLTTTSTLLRTTLATSSTTRFTSSLSGPPTHSYIEPGNCQLGPSFKPCTLSSIEKLTPDTKLYTFEAPDVTKPLNLPTCGCILASGGDTGGGELYVRPYTPVSHNKMVGKFQLMVKTYPNGGLSSHMDCMEAGDELNFKHIPFNVKIQYPFKSRHVLMLVGGTGIAPMIQALHSLLGNKDDKTVVTMLYGSRKEGDILARDTLGRWEDGSGGRFKVVNVLSQEDAGSRWEGERGVIDRGLIEKYMGGRGTEDTMVFVCGPEGMYESLCGPRGEEEVRGVLGDMGWGTRGVYKF